MALTQVSASGIKDGSISSNDLADGSISTSKVADDAITADKLNNTGVTAGSYTLSSVTVDAQGRVTAASSGTPVDADKIIEGNTEVEAVDTGSDGHIKATTEGSERLRVGPAGQVGIGGANYGTTGQVLMSGGASAAPTWGDVSSSPTFEATASGALTDGAPVVINSDGTVSAITGSGSVATKSTDYGANSDNSQEIAACYDTTNDKIVAIYKALNHSGRAHCVVGDVSGTTVTWGTEFQIGPSSEANFISSVYMPDVSRVLTVYKVSQYNQMVYQIGSISGSGSSSTGTFTSSTNVVSNTFSGEAMRMAYDTNVNKVVLLYQNQSNQYLEVKIGTPGTSSITWGSAYTVATDASNHHFDLEFDPNTNKVLIVYRDPSDSYRGKCRVATVASDNTVTFGSVIQYAPDSEDTEKARVVYNSDNNKMAILYLESTANSAYPKAKVVFGTINGSNNTFTFGSPILLDNNIRPYDSQGPHDFAYSPNGQRYIYAWSDQNDARNGYYYSFRESINGVDLDTKVEFKSSHVAYTNLVYDPDTQNTHFVYQDQSSAFNELQSVVIKPDTIVTNLQTNNFIGISNAAYSNGQTATIQLASSVDDAQSGLTPGVVYYINQNNGSLQTTPDIISAQAGVAVAATKLLIK